MEKLTEKEVVRCIDCTKYDKFDIGTDGYCKALNTYVYDSAYCSWAVKKGEDKLFRK